jgi:CheY-like chemotaxis protein
MANIFLIDDDMAMDVLADALRFRGHTVRRMKSAAEALQELELIANSDLVILDIIMPWPEDRPKPSFSSAGSAGMEVLRDLRARRATLPVVAYSGTCDTTVEDAIADDPCCTFISKWDGCSLRDLLRQIQRKLEPSGEVPAAPTFIVHGRDETTKLAVKNYLQNTLSLGEPIVLHEQPNAGRTIIEKFEDYAAMSALVFVLLTPDDVGGNGDDPDDQKRRARQNVIFEMGYFLGMIGRQSGRVILLYRPPLELPSDISGVIYVDISGGVEAAGEAIRKEVAHATSRNP